MEYEEKELMLNDCMRWLKFTCSDIFQLKPVMFVVHIKFVIHFIVLLLHIVYFARHPDLDIIIKYFPTLSIHFFGNVVYSAFIIKGKIVSNVLEFFKLWTIDSADEITKRKIEKEALLATAFASCTYVMLFLLAILASFSSKSNGDMFLVIELMHRNSFPSAFILMYRILFAALVCVCSVHSIQIIYGTLHAKFQIYLLQKHFQYIMRDEQNIEVYNNEDYQRQIEKRLVFCIKRHQFLLIAFLGKIEEIGFFMVAFAVAVVVVGMGCVAFMYTCYQHDRYWLAALAFVEFLMIYVGFIIYGQKVEERADDLLDYVTKDNRWYLWNNKNKRIFLLLLSALQRKLQIKFISDVCINYQLGVAIVKGIFSVGNVYIQMKLRTIRLETSAN